MNYNLKPSQFFLEQLDELSADAARILKNKLLLAKQNPFRNKQLVGFENLKLFRLRLQDRNKEIRPIYLVNKQNIELICIVDRGNEYKYLRKYLKKLGYL
jgi:mRNA-degrading endonuclease RelE of RelBE toxin-antitoxin system